MLTLQLRTLPTAYYHLCAAVLNVLVKKEKIFVSELNLFRYMTSKVFFSYVNKK